MMLSRHKKVPGVRRIAVLRANVLGDFIFALPALEALRAAYPQAEIVLLAKKWHATFLQGRPGPVDRVVAVPPFRMTLAPFTWPRQLGRQPSASIYVSTCLRRACPPECTIARSFPGVFNVLSVALTAVAHLVSTVLRLLLIFLQRT